MPFKPGQSGNPKGRTPKPRTGPDRLRAAMLVEAPAILTKLVELAKGGDVAAAKEVLGRCLPPLRPKDQPVALPLGTEIGQASRAVLSALGAGGVTPDEAGKIAAVIAALARTHELVEIERRLNSIEELLNERQAR